MGPFPQRRSAVAHSGLIATLTWLAIGESPLWRSHIVNQLPLLQLHQSNRDACTVIDIEIQNETHQTHEQLKFAVVPRIGEGLRLQEPNGFWASYDVIDLWYQKADYGDVWVPFLHVRKTAGEVEKAPSAGQAANNDGEVVPFTI